MFQQQLFSLNVPPAVLGLQAKGDDGFILFDQYLQLFIFVRVCTLCLTQTQMLLSV